jgi:hypothetical protein
VVPFIAADDPLDKLIPTEFCNCALVWNHRDIIFDNLADDYEEATIKRYRNLLRVVVRVIEQRQFLGLPSPAFSHDVDSIFVVEFLLTIAEEKDRAAKAAFFYRVLLAIGVPSTVLPPNPYEPEEPKEPVVPTQEQMRSIVKMLKEDCQLVWARQRKLAALEEVAQDPRRVSGGKRGSWSEMASGYYAVSRIVGIHLRPCNSMKSETWFSTVMRGLEKCPGPTVVDGHGVVSVQYGWNGHVRWFHPFHDDLIPIMLFVMVRTGFNFSTVVRLKICEWEEPYPFAHDLNDEFCFVRGLKYRGKQNPGDPPIIVRTVSAKRPWSHPYKLLKFLEELTSTLRKSINERIRELQSTGQSVAETAELKHLLKIKDDLFIYRTQSGKHAVNSLATYASGGLADTAMRFLSRYGLAGGVRSMRNYRLSFAFEASGHHLAFVKILAGHATGRTSIIYAKRKAALDRVYNVFKEVFSLSVALIKAKQYTTDNVKVLLHSQGLSDREISDAMDPQFVTRWGNGCATPMSPPRGFDADTPANHYCRHQNCIDGCPSARWFPDAVNLIRMKVAELEARRGTLGLQSLLSSSLDSRIRRCREILAEIEAQALPGGVT